MTVLCQRPPLTVMGAAAEKCAVELVVACPVLTLTHAVVYLRSAKTGIQMCLDPPHAE